MSIASVRKTGDTSCLPLRCAYRAASHSSPDSAAPLTRGRRRAGLRRACLGWLAREDSFVLYVPFHRVT